MLKSNLLTKTVLFCLLFILLVNTVQGYTEYDVFKNEELQDLIKCTDYNIENFGEKGCYKSVPRFFSKYNDNNGFKDDLKNDLDLNGLFENENFVKKAVLKYYRWSENRLKENIKNNAYWVGGPEPENTNNVYGVLLLKKNFLMQCRNNLGHYEVCGEFEDIVEQYKEILEKAIIYYLEVMPTEEGWPASNHSYNLAVIGMHLVGKDNDIIYALTNTEYIKKQAKRSLEFQEFCVQTAQSNQKIYCAENVVWLSQVFPEELFGAQKEIKNLKAKLDKIATFAGYAADESQRVQDENGSLPRSELAGKSYLRLFEIQRQYFDDNFRFENELLLKTLAYSVDASDDKTWEQAFFYRKNLIKNQSWSGLLSTLLLIIIAVVVLFCLNLVFNVLCLFTKLNKTFLGKLKINKFLEKFLNFGESKSSFILNATITIWIGLIFASTFAIQVNQTEREVLAIQDLGLRMTYLEEIDRIIQNEVLFNYAWVFLSLAIVFLILSIIARHYKEEGTESLFFGFYFIGAIMAGASIFWTFKPIELWLSFALVTLAGFYLVFSTISIIKDKIAELYLRLRNPLKLRIVKTICDDKCAACKNQTATIHNIDGNIFNNDYENLVWLCENCQGQKKVKKIRNLTEKDIKNYRKLCAQKFLEKNTPKLEKQREALDIKTTLEKRPKDILEAIKVSKLWGARL